MIPVHLYKLLISMDEYDFMIMEELIDDPEEPSVVEVVLETIQLL